ncbi:MAG: GTPase [Rhodospirillaceae bacterium]|jgi:GTP-binding protein Era|nr:GTPase [Rhodospirillaceae bacterium]
MADSTHCGFVAIIGAPNVGKSTLLNRLVGAKVSIVSPKVQTTRRRVLGILVEGDTQMIFLDTPGIFAPRRRLDRAMVRTAWQSAGDADLIVLLVDATKARPDADTQAIIDELKRAGRRAILVLNKVDAVKREKLLGLTQRLFDHGIFDEVFMISAETGDGVEDLMKTLAARMPEGPWHYPPDQISDMPMREIAAEITREQLFRQLRDELPYALTVEPETWEEFADDSLRISQEIFVERPSQKAIVLGEGGNRIKAVRVAAQQEIEAFTGRRVHLFLHVKVRGNWQEDPERYRAMGLDFDNG